MLNILLIANTQSRVHDLIRELWLENNEVRKRVHTVMVDDTCQISGFSKDNVGAIRSLKADQLFIEEDLKLTPEQATAVFKTLWSSEIPEEFQVVRLKEMYDEG